MNDVCTNFQDIYLINIAQNVFTFVLLYVVKSDRFDKEMNELETIFQY